MKKPLIACFFAILSIGVFAQKRIAKGYVLDKDSRAAISNAAVSVQDTLITSLTDEGEHSSLRYLKSTEPF